MKNKLRYFMVLTALAMCFGTFSVTAYAQSNEPQEETAPVEETTEPEETATPNPFTARVGGTHQAIHIGTVHQIGKHLELFLFPWVNGKLPFLRDNR